MFEYHNPKKRHKVPNDLFKSNKQKDDKEDAFLETQMVDPHSIRENSFMDIASKVGNQKMLKFIKSMGNLDLFSVGEEEAELGYADQSLNKQGKPKKDMKNRLKSWFPHRPSEINSVVSESKADDNLRKPDHQLKGDWIRKLFKGINQMGNGLKSIINKDEEKEEEVMERDRLMTDEEKMKNQLSDGLIKMIQEMNKDDLGETEGRGMEQRNIILKLLTSIGVSFQELYKHNADPTEQKKLLKSYLNEE